MPSFEELVRAVIEDLRPMLHADGGDIDLVSTDEARGRVEVHLRGACSHCSASMITLTVGVESRLKQQIPAVREVVHV
ncbi:MAG TPA: NifU family protein [Planctomycetota bacterium]|nr:NifU family protein [Planctomycetota bacterium]